MTEINRYLPLARHSALGLATSLIEGSKYCPVLAEMVQKEGLRDVFQPGRDLIKALRGIKPAIEDGRINQLMTISGLLRGHFTDVPEISTGLLALRLIGMVQAGSMKQLSVESIAVPPAEDLRLFAGVCQFVGASLREWAESQESKREPSIGIDQIAEIARRRGLSDDVVLSHGLQGSDEDSVIAAVSAMPWDVEKSLMFLSTLPMESALGVLTGLALADDLPGGSWRQGDVEGLVGGMLATGLSKVLSRGTIARTLKRIGERSSSTVDSLVEAKRNLAYRITEIDEAIRLLVGPAAQGKSAIERLGAAQVRLSALYRNLDTRYLVHLMNRAGRSGEGVRLTEEWRVLDKRLLSGSAVPVLGEGGVTFKLKGSETREDVILGLLNPRNPYEPEKGSVLIRTILEEASASQDQRLRDASHLYCSTVLRNQYSALSTADRVYFASFNFQHAYDLGPESVWGYFEKSLETVETKFIVLLVPVARALVRRLENKYLNEVQDAAEALLKKILLQMMESAVPEIVMESVQIAARCDPEAVRDLPVREKLHALLGPAWNEPVEGMADVGGRVTIDRFFGGLKQPLDQLLAEMVADALYGVLKVEHPESLTLQEIRQAAMLQLDQIDPQWRNVLAI